MTPRLQRARDIVLIVLATGVAFCNVFPNAFHLDDFCRVVGNPGIQQVHLHLATCAERFGDRARAAAERQLYSAR